MKNDDCVLWYYDLTKNQFALFPHCTCPTRAFVDLLSLRKVPSVFSIFSSSKVESKIPARLVQKRPTLGAGVCALPTEGPPPTTCDGRLGLILRTWTRLLQVTLLLTACASLGLLPCSSTTTQQHGAVHRLLHTAKEPIVPARAQAMVRKLRPSRCDCVVECLDFQSMLRRYQLARLDTLNWLYCYTSSYKKGPKIKI